MAKNALLSQIEEAEYRAKIAHDAGWLVSSEVWQIVANNLRAKLTKAA